MENKNQPLVSIGVPVYNGQEGIASALDLLLEQDYSNFEVIISDNGSTDATPDICKEYLQKDARIEYHRSEENHGCNWNFNRVVKLSTGKYFMWAAHDDQRDKSFVRECVQKMEQNPDAVLCQTHTALYIEGRSDLLATNDLASFEGVKGSVPQYRETLKNFPATAIYGLYRLSVMRKIPIFENIIASDQVFIQALSILGEFVQVPKVLFHYYGREKWQTVHQDYFNFTGIKRKPWWYLPFVLVFCSNWNRVACSPVSLSVKLRLWGILIGHEIQQTALKILTKVGRLIFPERLKEKLGCAIYWRWMHTPNIKVGCEEFFLERVIKPKLGWWN